VSGFGYELHFLRALLFTIGVETVVLFVMLRTLYRSGHTRAEILFAGFLCSFATLPYVWFLFPILAKIGSHSLYIWSAEISVTLIESAILYKLLRLGYKEALILSVCANIASYGLGILLHV